MQIKEFSIALDMKRTLAFPPFEVVEGDTGNVLHVALTNDGEAVDLGGCNVCIVFASSAGFAIQDLTSGIALGEGTGTFSVTLYPGSYGAGDVRADVQVYSGDNEETLITSKRFTFRCIKGLMQPDIIRAGSAYPPLVQAAQTAREAAAEARAAAAQALSSAQSDWTEADATDAAFIRNKPSSFLPSAHAPSHGTDGADAITPANIGAAADTHTHTPASIGAIPTTEKGAMSGVATLDASRKVDASQASAAVVALSASATLALAHAGKLLAVNSAAAVTLTVPTNASVAFPIGTEIEVCQYGAGAVTIAAASVVTLRSMDAAVSTSGQYACVSLKKIESDIWLLAGALA